MSTTLFRALACHPERSGAKSKAESARRDPVVPRSQTDPVVPRSQTGPVVSPAASRRRDHVVSPVAISVVSARHLSSRVPPSGGIPSHDGTCRGISVVPVFRAPPSALCRFRPTADCRPPFPPSVVPICEHQGKDHHISIENRLNRRSRPQSTNTLWQTPQFRTIIVLICQLFFQFVLTPSQVLPIKSGGIGRALYALKQAS